MELVTGTRRRVETGMDVHGAVCVSVWRNMVWSGVGPDMEPRCPGVMASWCPWILVCRFPGVQVSRCPIVLVYWYQGVLLIRCLKYSLNVF